MISVKHKLYQHQLDKKGEFRKKIPVYPATRAWNRLSRRKGMVDIRIDMALFIGKVIKARGIRWKA